MIVVASTQQNIHILHELVRDLQATLDQYLSWGRPLGSTLLWKQHMVTIQRISEMVNSIQIKEVRTLLLVMSSDLDVDFYSPTRKARH